MNSESSEKGILISGGGREETQAELSRNEKLFNQLAEYLFTEAGSLFGYKSVDDAKRKLIKDVRELRKINPSFSLDELLDFMFQTKEDKVIIVKEKEAITKAITDHLKDQINRKNEQDLFSVLSAMPADIAQTVGEKEEPEVIN